jgi:hypothetical protein
MYQNPTLLPQFSNREDFLLPIQIYDDDTFQPIDLIRTSTANGQAFTSSAWTITDGAISTTSATSITIPVFPTGAQLSTLALTVGVGLGILAGDPIKIADTATGLNVMNGYVLNYASATGALVVQIGFTFQFEIRRTGPGWPTTDYSAYYDFGISAQSPVLTASLANGYLTVIDVGALQIRIPEVIFKSLNGGTYGACLTLTDSVNTRQLFIGKLPVIWGGVTV